MALLFFANASALANNLDYKSVWECDSTKFNWYCKIEKDTKNQFEKPTREKEALDKLKKWQEELEAKRALSIIDPTPENIKAYIKAQEKLLQTASVYSDVWRRVIWQTPELNYGLKRPVNNAGIEEYNRGRRDSELKTLNELSKEWGIFFFFRSDCPYCHVMASTLKTMTEYYDIQIFPVTLDGGVLPEYPDAKQDNGLSSILNITQVPTMVLGNIRDRRMILLGSGVISVNEIIERIYILTQTKPGEMY
jgi:conjugal transfer pilus assembly protein TraF